jgi:hypothetical protein
MKKVSQRAKILGAFGFFVAVESIYSGTNFDLVPVNIPGILITEVRQNKGK